MKLQTELIAINFGKQLQGDMYDMVQEWAVEYDLSIEDATNDCYKYMTWSLSEVNNNWQSHFDIMFSSIFGRLVDAPDVMFDVTHLNGFKMPTLFFQSKYVKDRLTGKKHSITNELVEKFGYDFQEEFGLEFLSFERVEMKPDLSISLSKNDHRSPPKNSLVYFISNKPHFFNGKKFLPIIVDFKNPHLH